MKFMKLACVCLSFILCCTLSANENKYVFIGENGEEGAEQTAFILELVGDNFESYVKISETGEIYLKVDRITAIPKDTLSNCVQLVNFDPVTKEPYLVESTEAFGRNPLDPFTALSILTRTEEKTIRCKNPECRYTFIARPGHYDCPRCGTSN